MRWTVLICLAIALLGTTPVRGQITPIGPFTGSHFDNFNNTGIPGGGGVQQVDVFGGFCTVRNITQGSGALKIEFSSSLDSDLVTPRSAPAMLGQLCISEWTFDAPIFRYGGYWENNSRFDHANVTFFDVNNDPIGTVSANVPRFAQTWTWNGWESTVPVSKIQVVGNDVAFFNGFIWWEDFNITVAAVPEPNTYALLTLCAVVVGFGYYFRRRQAAKSLDVVD